MLLKPPLLRTPSLRRGRRAPRAGRARARRRLAANRAPLENSAAARLLLDALLLTPPFVAVGRSVTANAELWRARVRAACASGTRCSAGATRASRRSSCRPAWCAWSGTTTAAIWRTSTSRFRKKTTRDFGGPFGDARAAVRGGSSSRRCRERRKRERRTAAHRARRRGRAWSPSSARATRAGCGVAAPRVRRRLGSARRRRRRRPRPRGGSRCGSSG